VPVRTTRKLSTEGLLSALDSVSIRASCEVCVDFLIFFPADLRLLIFFSRLTLTGSTPKAGADSVAGTGDVERSDAMQSWQARDAQIYAGKIGLSIVDGR
jgi:hypothetical protein